MGKSKLTLICFVLMISLTVSLLVSRGRQQCRRRLSQTLQTATTTAEAATIDSATNTNHQHHQISLTSVKNFRDISHVNNQTIASCRVYRTACVSNSNERDVRRD